MWNTLGTILVLACVQLGSSQKPNGSQCPPKGQSINLTATLEKPAYVIWPVKGYEPCEQITWEVINGNLSDGITLHAKFNITPEIGYEDYVLISANRDKAHTWVATAATPDFNNYMITEESFQVDLFRPTMDRNIMFNITIEVQYNGGNIQVGSEAENIQHTPNKAVDTYWTLSADNTNDQLVVSIDNTTTKLTGGSELYFYEGHSTENEILKLTNESKLITVFSLSSEMLIYAKNFTGVFTASVVASVAGKQKMSKGVADFVRMTGPFTGGETARWLIKPSKPGIYGLTIKYAHVYPNVSSSVNLFVNTVQFLSVTQPLTTPRLLFIDLKEIDSYLHVEYTSEKDIAYDVALLSGSYDIPTGDCMADVVEVNDYKTTTHDITSTGFPTTYPFQAQCTMPIDIDSTYSMIHVSFIEIELVENHSLNFTVTTITGSVVESVSGPVTSLPDDMVFFEASKVVIDFDTSALDHISDAPPKGFNIKLNVIQCGDLFMDNPGSFVVKENETRQCLWRFDFPEPSNIKFTINTSDTKRVPRLTFLDGGSFLTAKNLSYGYNKDGMATFLSISNRVFAVLEPSGDSSELNITYSNQGCKRTCDNSTKCMQDSWICNGVVECADFSDEKDCYYRRDCENPNSEVQQVNGTLKKKFSMPFHYTPIQCSWTFQSANHRNLRARFTILNLNQPEEFVLVTDYLGVIPNAIATPYNTKEMKGLDILSSNDKLFVNFTSGTLDAAVEIEFTEQSVPPEGARCTAKSGNSCHLQVPSNSPEDVPVIFFVDAEQENNQVQVTVLQTSELLPAATLEFYDGYTKDLLLARFLSQDQLYYPVFSMSNKMMIVANHFTGPSAANLSVDSIPKGQKYFHSDSHNVLCVGQINEPGLEWIISPTVDASNAKDSVVALRLDMSKMHGNVTVIVQSLGRDQQGVHDIAVFRPPFYEVQTAYARSESGVKVIILTNETFTEDRTFDGSYEVVPAIEYHGSFHRAGQENVLTSPGYPNLYPLNANTFWSYQTHGLKVLIAFSDVDLHEEDTLEIRSTVKNETKSVANITGSKLPDDLLIEGDEVIVEWSSNRLSKSNSNVGKGFSLKAKSLDCGDYLTSESASFTAPSSSHGNLECVWIVSLPSKDPEHDTGIIQATLDSTPTELEVHDGGSLQSPLVDLQKSVLSRTNKLVFHYNYIQQEKNEAPKFGAKYETKVCGRWCENKICMHHSWACNGLNDCGDGSDEFNCTTAPAPSSGGVSKGWLAGGIILGLVFGGILALGAEFLIKKRASKNGEGYRSFSGREEE